MNNSTSCVFVGNLAWSTTEEDIATFCSQAGEVLKSEVMRHEYTNRSKGWGLVEFSSAESAASAVSTLNGGELKGRAVHIRLDRTSTEQNIKGVKVYIGNIPWATTGEDLVKLFSTFNPLGCHVLTNMYGRSRGFALMTFSTEEEARKAIDAFNGHQLEGRNIECRVDRGPAGKVEESNRSARVFVGKLDSTVNDSVLAAAFAHIGPIVSATVSRHPDGRSKGWGLVHFESMDAANAAVETVDGKVIGGGNTVVRVRLDKK